MIRTLNFIYNFPKTTIFTFPFYILATTRMPSFEEIITKSYSTLLEMIQDVEESVKHNGFVLIKKNINRNECGDYDQSILSWH